MGDSDRGEPAQEDKRSSALRLWNAAGPPQETPWDASGETAPSPRPASLRHGVSSRRCALLRPNRPRADARTASARDRRRAGAQREGGSLPRVGGQLPTPRKARMPLLAQGRKEWGTMLPIAAIVDAKNGLSYVAGSELEDHLWPARERFPLGRGLDVPEPDGEPASNPGVRPFGLRYLTKPEKGATRYTPSLDLTQVSYCPERQLSMLGGQPLIYASTKIAIPTETQAREDNQTFPDKDTDYQSD